MLIVNASHFVKIKGNIEKVTHPFLQQFISRALLQNPDVKVQHLGPEQL